MSQDQEQSQQGQQAQGQGQGLQGQVQGQQVQRGQVQQKQNQGQQVQQGQGQQKQNQGQQVQQGQGQGLQGQVQGQQVQQGQGQQKQNQGQQVQRGQVQQRSNQGQQGQGQSPQDQAQGHPQAQGQQGSGKESLNPAYVHAKKEFQLPMWECEWKDIEKFTVGDSKKLFCYGEYIERIAGSVKILVSDKRMDWWLYPLDVISSENESVTLLVTSYKAGKLESLPFVVIGKGIDGMTGFEVSSLSWEVQSVIKNPQKPQGYGPSEPLGLSWPEWLWWGWGLALFWLLFVGVAKLVRVYKKQEIIRNLSKYRTSRSPYHQYHWEMRRIGREYQSPNYIRKVQREGAAKEYLSELNKTFRLYFVREFQVPALEWKSYQVVEEIKGRHKLVSKTLGTEIRQTMREFEKATSSPHAVGMDDCRQFHQMSFRIVEKIREVVEK